MTVTMLADHSRRKAGFDSGVVSASSARTPTLATLRPRFQAAGRAVDAHGRLVGEEEAPRPVGGGAEPDPRAGAYVGGRGARQQGERPGGLVVPVLVPGDGQ